MPSRRGHQRCPTETALTAAYFTSFILKLILPILFLAEAHDCNLVSRVSTSST